jgi:hypothetical protein
MDYKKIYRFTPLTGVTNSGVGVYVECACGGISPSLAREFTCQCGSMVIKDGVVGGNMDSVKFMKGVLK